MTSWSVATPNGHYSAFFYCNNPFSGKRKKGCNGLAWLLPKDDDEYRFTKDFVYCKYPFQRILNFYSIVSMKIISSGGTVLFVWLNLLNPLSCSFLCFLCFYALPCIVPAGYCLFLASLLIRWFVSAGCPLVQG